MLICIEANINSIRKVVCIYSHTFQVMSIINSNTNLSIVIISKRQFLYATPKFDYAVFICTAIFCINDLKPLRR